MYFLSLRMKIMVVVNPMGHGNGHAINIKNGQDL